MRKRLRAEQHIASATLSWQGLLCARDPGQLAIFTVPTRELREEVVLGLVCSKVRILSLQSTCGSSVVHAVSVRLFFLVLIVWPGRYRGPDFLGRQARGGTQAA